MRTHSHSPLLLLLAAALLMAACSDDPAPSPASSEDTGGEDMPTEDMGMDSEDFSPGDLEGDQGDRPSIDETPLEEGLGGEATVESEPGRPFATLLRDLPLEQFQAGSRGREFFVAEWEPGNRGRELLNGLGPLFHATSCVACHPASGRAQSWRADGSMGAGVLLRLHRVSSEGKVLGGDSVYGSQLQPFSLGIIPREAAVRWDEGLDEPERDDAAFFVSLGGDRSYTVYGANYGDFDANTRAHARLSPHLTGMGLLDHIADEEILEWEDPEDLDGDGISGRANWLQSGDEEPRLGRYGWKGNVATLREQVAFAFSGDMGITSPLAPQQRCTEAQTACAEAPSGGEPEVSDTALDDVVEYLRLLGVPARNVTNPAQEQKGYRLFHSVGCASCHRPTLHTRDFDDNSVLSNQRIHPFTDLLLHDMGPSLDDGVPDGAATGSEWKTPPLWGIGRVAEDRYARFLHDGRAATMKEAILAHDGEGRRSQEGFASLAGEEQEALLAFLRSL